MLPVNHRKLIKYEVLFTRSFLKKKTKTKTCTWGKPEKLGYNFDILNTRQQAKYVTVSARGPVGLQSTYGFPHTRPALTLYRFEWIPFIFAPRILRKEASLLKSKHQTRRSLIHHKSKKSQFRSQQTNLLSLLKWCKSVYGKENSILFILLVYYKAQRLKKIAFFLPLRLHPLSIV